LVSCKFVGVENIDAVKDLIFSGKNEFVYDKTREGEELKIYVDSTEKNKYGFLSKCYIDYIVNLYNRTRGNFQVVVSESFEIQLYVNEQPPLLAIFAPKNLAQKILYPIRSKTQLITIIFDLSGKYEKIKSHPAFQDVKQLKLSNIADPYLEKAAFYGRKITYSPIVETIAVSIGAKFNALAIVYRNIWVLVTADARMFTPIPARKLPGTKPGFFLDLYKELKKIDAVKYQQPLY